MLESKPLFLLPSIWKKDTPVRKRISWRTWGLLSTVLVVLVGQAQQAQAQLAPFLTKTGKIHVSIDGVGTNSPPATIEVDKPSATATVSSVHCACAGTPLNVVNDGQVSIGGIAVNGFVQVVNGSFRNALADITASHSALINALPVGISSLVYNENNTFQVDGCTLAVIWDFPESPIEQTAILFFGGQATTGDQFVVSLADPIDLNNPDLKLDFGLGISFGAQDQPLWVAKTSSGRLLGVG